MRIDDQAAGSGASRWGWWRVRLPRPTGIRNGGLLLVPVALAAVVALVDEPPELGDGRPGPPEPPASPPRRSLGAVPGRRRDPGRPGPGWVGVAGRVPAAGDDDAGG